MVEKHRGAVGEIALPPTFCRGSVRITNAWDRVEYKKKTGRSEATENEILAQRNLDRLRRELSGIEHAIICCGDKAQLAVRKLRERNKIDRTVGVFWLLHLGDRALNKRWENKEFRKARNSKERHRSRIEKVAECLSSQIDSWFESEARRQSSIVANSPRAQEDQDFVDAISVWNEE